MTFAELGLAPDILKALSEQGYSEPTPIQAKAIPVVLSGKDIMAGAQTGTGKTAGFTLPLLQSLLPHANPSASPARHPVRALILTPTRELAVQVAESVATYSKYLPLRSAVVYGGMDIKPQIAELMRGVEILVATPGRLLDHVEGRSVNLGQVQFVVLDEADRMLDMGFIPDIKRILNLLPKTRQSLLFSATFSEEIKRLADGMLKNPELVEVARRNTVSETITHEVHPVSSFKKRALLAHIIRRDDLQQVLVFVRTKFGASRLARELDRDGIKATAIHGDRSQQQREQALADFKEGRVTVLVATDVAARGIDIEDLPHVINYEIPHVPEDYVHRIGRTGRAGKMGDAISLVSAEETHYLVDIEKLVKLTIPQTVVEGFEPESDYEYPPSGRRKRGGRAGSSDKAAPASQERRKPRDEADRVGKRSNKRPPMVAEDGFDFSKPYESAAPGASEAAATPQNPAQPPQQTLSGNPPARRGSREVAFLLGGGPTRAN